MFPSIHALDGGKPGELKRGKSADNSEALLAADVKGGDHESERERGIERSRTESGGTLSLWSVKEDESSSKVAQPDTPDARYKALHDKLQLDSTANALRALLLSKKETAEALLLADETALDLAMLNRQRSMEQSMISKTATTLALELSDANVVKALALSEKNTAEALLFSDQTALDLAALNRKRSVEQSILNKIATSAALELSDANTVAALLLSERNTASALEFSDQTALDLAKLNRQRDLELVLKNRHATVVALELSDANTVKALLLSQKNAAEALRLSDETAQALANLNRVKALEISETNARNALKALSNNNDIMAELLVAQTQRLEDKKEAEIVQQRFVRYVFHELRIPLHSICMAMDLLHTESASLSEQGRETLEMLNTACLSMKEIINDTLDYSKLETGSFQVSVAPVTFSHVVRDALFVMRPYSNAVGTEVLITCDVDPKLAYQRLLLDGKRMQQVLTNVLSNAIKFAPHDGTGTARLSAKLVEESYVASLGVHWTRKNKNEESVSMLRRTNSNSDDVNSLFNGRNTSEAVVLISVKDNGPGISADDIPLLFQPFRQMRAGLTVKEKGTGLGLSIVQEIVMLHGGKVGVKAVVGEGAEFFILLRVPIVQAPAGIEGGESSQQDQPGPGSPAAQHLGAPDDVAAPVVFYPSLKFLVVDDVPSNRKLLRRLLEVNFTKMFHNDGVFTTSRGLRARIGEITFTEAEDGNFALQEVLGGALASNAECLSQHRLPRGFVPDALLSERFDCITMDAQMPTLNGFETTRMIRSGGFTGPIIGCTGNSLQEDKDLFVACGVTSVHIKPIVVQHLLDEVLEAVVTHWSRGGLKD